MRAISTSIAAAFALAAFSACSPREQASAASEAANADNAATSQSEISAPVRPDLNMTMYVNAPSGLRVRSAPSTEGEILGALEHLAEVNIVREDDNIVAIGGTSGRWVYINSPVQGWIFNGYLETEEQREARFIGVEHRIWTALVDYLVQYTSLFSLGFGLDSDALVRWGWNGNLVDVDGNVIDGYPFFTSEFGIAGGFNLYDLDGDGIPEIKILYGWPESSLRSVTIHQYIDGSYRMVEIDTELLPNLVYLNSLWDGSEFFLDETEALILFVFDHMLVLGGYWRATLGAGRLEINPEPLADHRSMGWMEWEDYPYHHISIPGIQGSRLTPIPRLRDLEEEIRNAVMQRLGLR